MVDVCHRHELNSLNGENQKYLSSNLRSLQLNRLFQR